MKASQKHANKITILNQCMMIKCTHNVCIMGRHKVSLNNAVRNSTIYIQKTLFLLWSFIRVGICLEGFILDQTQIKTLKIFFPIYCHFKVTSTRPLFCVYTANEVGTPVMLHELSNEACDWRSKYTVEKQNEMNMHSERRIESNIISVLH